MSSDLDLLRATKRITGYLDAQVANHHSPIIDDVLTEMKIVQTMFPQWVLQTCLYRHPDVRFITPNCIYLFGHTPEYLMADIYPNPLFSCIYEDDSAYLHQCYTYINRFIKSFDPGKVNSLRFVFKYRIRHKKGQLVTIHDEKATLTMSNTFTLYYSLYKDVSKETTFTGVSIKIYEQSSQLKKIAEYRPNDSSQQLSKREGEMVQLMQQGLTTKEIAYRLAISPNTARNIKQKMFTRYSVGNTIELLNKILYYN